MAEIHFLLVKNNVVSCLIMIIEIGCGQERNIEKIKKPLLMITSNAFVQMYTRLAYVLN